MEILLTVLILFVGLVVVTIFFAGERQKEVGSALGTVDTPVAPDRQRIVGSGGIVIDDAARQLRLSWRERGEVHVRSIAWHDILSAEILEDGVKVQTSTDGVGRALVGGAVFGISGAIAGAATGSRETASKISRIELEILTRDPTRPRHVEVFHSTVPFQAPLATSSFAYRTHIGQAREWLARIRALIGQHEAASGRPRIVETLQRSLTDELARLAELHHAGTLSAAEFEAAKRKLLDA
jgi:hypothetical protein